jgi:hypothetical protein
MESRSTFLRHKGEPKEGRHRKGDQPTRSGCRGFQVRGQVNPPHTTRGLLEGIDVPEVTGRMSKKIF